MRNAFAQNRRTRTSSYLMNGENAPPMGWNVKLKVNHYRANSLRLLCCCNALFVYRWLVANSSRLSDSFLANASQWPNVGSMSTTMAQHWNDMMWLNVSCLPGYFTRRDSRWFFPCHLRIFISVQTISVLQTLLPLSIWRIHSCYVETKNEVGSWPWTDKKSIVFPFVVRGMPPFLVYCSA